MPQDRESGAAGNRYGREMAAIIADLLGTRLSGRVSNEAVFEGRAVVIKCAAPKTDQVGVPTGMLARLDAILGVFEQEDGSVVIWELPVGNYRARMEESRSASHAPGSLMKVRNKVFRSEGVLLKCFSRAEVSAARKRLS
jgi:hypothetical protein